MRKTLYIFLTIFALLLGGTAYAQFYNGSQMEFGKNRVQYMKDQFWSFYRFDRFDTYFYLGGKELAVYTAQFADREIPRIEKMLDYDLDDKIEFIIFNKLSDLKQSNIGLESDQQYNIGGVTHIVGSKVILYFNGDHRDLEEQIRAGIAQVVLDQMMYGGSIKDVVRNSTLLTLPEWYLEGLISYLSHDWDAEIENHVKDGVLNGDYEKLNRLTGEEARYAGHSIWRFIADTYGESVISNILYMTRISRNIDSGFLFVLGTSLKNLTFEWLAYYDKMYYNLNKMRNLPKEEPIIKKPRHECIFTQLELSPDGRYAAYSANDMGQYRVWVRDLQTGKKKKLMKVGYKSEQKPDHSFPLVTWHPSSQYLAILSERKGKIVLTQYDLRNKKKTSRPIHHFEKILDFSYSDDGKSFAFSAVQKGQSDIFVYSILGNTYYQVTNDHFDDLNPRFINNSKDIVFASNRNNDTIKPVDMELLPKDASTDLYLFKYSEKNPLLRRLTKTPGVNEIQPLNFDASYIAYLSDENGVFNRYLGKLDSTLAYVDTIAHYNYTTKSFPITNYARNIVKHSTRGTSGKISEIVYSDGTYKMYFRDKTAENASTGIQLEESKYLAINEKKKEKEEHIAEEPRIPEIPSNRIISVYEDSKKEPANNGTIDIDNYTFEGESLEEFGGEEVVQPQTIVLNPTPKKQTPARELEPTVQDSAKVFKLPNQRNYDVHFTTNYVVSQLDNSFINSTYQKFTGGGAVFFNPGFNGLFKIGIQDLMEDYKIVGGVRISGNLNSNEYFLSWQNFHDRLDKQIVFHRQSFLNAVEFSVVRINTHSLTYKVSWPFSEVAAVKGSVIARHDREVLLSTDLGSLQEPNEQTWLGGLKAEFVFDNTIQRGLNIYNGLRYKVFGEYYHQANNEGKHFTVLGLDVRHYLRIHRDLIWANRLAGSTSFGTQKLIYYLGGVDNWFAPKFDNSIPIDYTQNYAYQTIGTNMRGFHQNVRNGNSFAVINSEIRWPIFRYFFNRPIKSDFVNNFQLVGFGDVGSAWTGPSPYSDENSLTGQVIEQGPLTIRLKNQREPIVGGYGFGARSRILGYFIRVDYAWGVENGQVLDPLIYVSLSLDF